MAVFAEYISKFHEKDGDDKSSSYYLSEITNAMIDIRDRAKVKVVKASSNEELFFAEADTPKGKLIAVGKTYEEAFRKLAEQYLNSVNADS